MRPCSQFLPSAQTIWVHSLQEGTYSFALTVTDDSSATATDRVVITVLPVPATPITRTVNVNIYGTVNPYNHGEWNNWTVSNGSGNVSGLFNYSDSTISTIYASLSYSNGINDNYNGYGTGATMAPAEVLRYDSYSSSNRTLTLSGLSASKDYTIELYASRRTDGNPTAFTVAGISDTVNTFYNIADAAIFSGLSADSTGKLVITIGKVNSFTYLNGFKLVETASAARGRRIPQVVKQSSTALVTESKDLLLFPDPAENEVFFELNSGDKGTVGVMIFNTQGKTEKQFSFVKGAGQLRQRLDINGLAAGSYMLVVKTAAGGM